jgi:hypothetical protein
VELTVKQWHLGICTYEQASEILAGELVSHEDTSMGWDGCCR